MAYISSEKVAEIRKTIRAHFKDFKVSVRREDHSGVVVTFVKGPIEFNSEQDHYQINPYHYQNHLEHNPEAVKVISDTMKIIREVATQTYRETSDYGNQPNYYIDVNFGTYDKPYEKVA